ncbi:MAG: hypothetical protein WA188_08990 [Terriglobales bacterium]
MAVEKGTKAVISANFSVYGERTFNNLRANFVVGTPRKEFFNSHPCSPQSSSATLIMAQRSDMERWHITLGPLFPRLVAVYIGAVIVLVCWVLPVASPAASQTGKMEAFALGLLVLTVLFVPCYGSVEVDPAKRLLTFRESVAAGCLHAWRWRELRQFTLPEGSTVLIGFWLGPNAFATGGVQVRLPNGDSTLLFENKFGIDGRIASRLASALRSVEGVNVRTVRLSPTFELIEWTPLDLPTGANTALLFFLSWIAFPLGMLKANTAVILGAGAACFAVYSIAMYRVLRRTQNARPRDEKISNGAVFGLGLFQFALMYAVMVFLGASIR